MSTFPMRPFVAVALAVLALRCVAPLAGAEKQGWQPETTWVVIVGVLEWQQSGLYRAFPKAGRRDTQLADLFRAKGVPAAQILVLQDRRATLGQIRQTLNQVLPAANADDLLVLYYAGHGIRFGGTTYLANYDVTADTGRTGLSVISIVDAIEQNFRGSHVLLAADCCHSGALCVEVGKRQSRISYAALTSAPSYGTSTGHWTFTDCLLSGFQGDPTADLNADGRVELDELARFTEDEMAFAEEQLSSFATSNGFNPKLALATVQKPRVPGVGRRLEAEWEGSWWPARELAAASGKTRVRYAGFGPELDEWVGPERLRPYNTPRIYPRGTGVHVIWENKWWQATVKESRSGLHCIRYTGFGPEWDEWVGPKRIRP